MSNPVDSRKKKRRMVLWPVVVVIVLLLFFFIYTAKYYHADETAKEAMKSDVCDPSCEVNSLFGFPVPEYGSGR